MSKPLPPTEAGLLLSHWRQLRMRLRRFRFESRWNVLWIVALSLIYFGSYFDTGFNIGDEGSIMLITQQLLEGSRPYVDIELGYGPFWYLPLVLLFKVVGVNFLAVRLFFLALAVATSLLSYLVIYRESQKRWLAVLFAISIIAVPGTLHKTWIPLVVIANMACFPSFGRSESRLGGGRVALAGSVAALSYFVRPDIGLCVSLVLVAALLTNSALNRSGLIQRFAEAARVLSIAGCAALVPTTFFLALAWSGGYLEALLVLLEQPLFSIREILGEVARATDSLTFFSTLESGGSQGGAVSAPGIPPTEPMAGETAATEVPGTTLPRIPLGAVWGAGWSSAAAFSVLSYLPLVTLTLLALSAFIGLIRGMLSRRLSRGHLDTLAYLGLAVSAFPQFFLFRPDFNHLSQFMPGYLVLVGVYLGRPGVLERADGPCPPSLSWLPLLAGRVLTATLAVHVVLYVWTGLQRPDSGSIGRARDCNSRLVAANGISVRVKPNVHRAYSELIQLIEQHVSQDGILVCVPYCPGFNVLSNRKTSLKRLYVDDSLLKIDPAWQERFIERTRESPPQMIIVQRSALNRTEISRFENWATEVMGFVDSTYAPIGKIAGNRIFVPREAMDEESLP